MRYLSSIALLWFCLIRASVSAPLKIKITDPTQYERKHVDDVGRLNRAEESAHEQIGKMYDVIHNYHLPENKAMVHAAFGKKPNIEEIRKNIGTLKHGTIEIARVRDPKLGGAQPSVAETYHHRHRNADIHMGPSFHREISNEYRGGVLIHEAAHALFNAEDKHDVGPRPNDKNLLGYVWEQDFKTLRRDHSSIMHKNADSYHMLAQVATHRFAQQEAARQHDHAATVHDLARNSHSNAADHRSALAQANPGEADFHNNAAEKHRVQANLHKAHFDRHVTNAAHHRHESSKGQVSHESIASAHEASQAAQRSSSQAQATVNHMQAAYEHHLAADAHHKAAEAHRLVHEHTGLPAAADRQGVHNDAARKHGKISQGHIKSALKHSPANPIRADDADSAHHAHKSAVEAHEDAERAHKSARNAQASHNPRHSAQASHDLLHSTQAAHTSPRSAQAAHNLPHPAQAAHNPPHSVTHLAQSAAHNPRRPAQAAHNAPHLVPHSAQSAAHNPPHPAPHPAQAARNPPHAAPAVHNPPHSAQAARNAPRPPPRRH